jgi:hypothetical protein
MYENMYEKHVAIIVNRFGGFRERTIFKNPHTIEKTETWNKEHKVLNVLERNPGADGYRGGFQVDLVTMSICG